MSVLRRWLGVLLRQPALRAPGAAGAGMSVLRRWLGALPRRSRFERPARPGQV